MCFLTKKCADGHPTLNFFHQVTSILDQDNEIIKIAARFKFHIKFQNNQQKGVIRMRI